MLLILNGFSMGITIAVTTSCFVVFIIYSIYLSSLVPRNRKKFPYYDPIEKNNEFEQLSQSSSQLQLSQSSRGCDDKFEWLNVLLDKILLSDKDIVSYLLANLLRKQAMEIYNQIQLDLPFPVDKVELAGIKFGSAEPKVESILADSNKHGLSLNARIFSASPFSVIVDVSLLAGRVITCEFIVQKFEGDLEICLGASEKFSLVSMTFSDLPEISLNIDCDIKSFSSVIEMVVHRIKVICSKMFVKPSRYNMIIDKCSNNEILCTSRGGLQHGIKPGSILLKLNYADFMEAEAVSDKPSELVFYYCSMIHDNDRYHSTYQPMSSMGSVTWNESFFFRHEGPLGGNLVIRLYAKRGRLSKDNEIGFLVIKLDRILFNKQNILTQHVTMAGKQLPINVNFEVFRHSECFFPGTPFLNNHTTFNDSGILFGLEDGSEFEKRTEKSQHTRSNSSRNSNSKHLFLGSADVEGYSSRNDQPDIRFLGLSLYDSVGNLLHLWTNSPLPKLLSEKENLTFMYYEVGFVAKFLQNEIVDLQACLHSLLENDQSSLNECIPQISSSDIQIRCIIERIKDLLQMMNSEAPSLEFGSSKWQNALDVISERLTNLVHIVCLMWRESSNSNALIAENKVKNQNSESRSAYEFAIGDNNDDNQRDTFDRFEKFPRRQVSGHVESSNSLLPSSSSLIYDNGAVRSRTRKVTRCISENGFCNSSSSNSISILLPGDYRDTAMESGAKHPLEVNDHSDLDDFHIIADNAFVSPPIYLVENKTFSCKLYNIRGYLNLGPTAISFKFQDNQSNYDRMIGVCYRVTKSWEPYQKPVEKHLFQKWNKWYRFSLDNESFSIRNPDDSLYRIKKIIGLEDIIRLECMIPVLNANSEVEASQPIALNSLPKAILSFYTQSKEASSNSIEVIRFAMDLGTAQQVFERIQSVLFVDYWIGNAVDGCNGNTSISISYDCLADSALSNQPVINNLNQGLPLVQQHSCVKVKVKANAGQCQGSLIFTNFVGSQDLYLDTVNQFISDKVEECENYCLTEDSDASCRSSKGAHANVVVIGRNGNSVVSDPIRSTLRWETSYQISDFGGYRYFQQDQIVDSGGYCMESCRDYHLSPLYKHFRIRYPANLTVHEYLCSFDPSSSVGVTSKSHSSHIPGSFFVCPDYVAFVDGWTASKVKKDNSISKFVNFGTSPSTSMTPSFRFIFPVNHVKSIKSHVSSILRQKSIAITMKTGTIFTFCRFKDGSLSATDCINELRLFCRSSNSIKSVDYEQNDDGFGEDGGFY